MRGVVRSILVAWAVLLTACDWFDDPSPDTARLRLEGDPGAVVRLVTSVQFLAARTPSGEVRVQLLSADTSRRALPFDTVYTIRGYQRFFAEAARADADVASFRMRVFLDRVPRFDEVGPLREGAPYRFLYALNQYFRDVREVF